MTSSSNAKYKYRDVAVINRSLIPRDVGFKLGYSSLLEIFTHYDEEKQKLQDIQQWFGNRGRASSSAASDFPCHVVLTREQLLIILQNQGKLQF